MHMRAHSRTSNDFRTVTYQLRYLYLSIQIAVNTQQWMSDVPRV